MRFLDSLPQVKKWTKEHRIRIPYREGRKRRRYIPDILVEYVDGRKALEEIKGHVWDPMNFARKNVAALLYCRARGIEFRILRKGDLSVVT